MVCAEVTGLSRIAILCQKLEKVGNWFLCQLCAAGAGPQKSLAKSFIFFLFLLPSSLASLHSYCSGAYFLQAKNLIWWLSRVFALRCCWVVLSSAWHRQLSFVCLDPWQEDWKNTAAFPVELKNFSIFVSSAEKTTEMATHTHTKAHLWPAAISDTLLHIAKLAR